MMKLIHVCSFVDAEGSCTVAGRKWQWEFSEQFGPLFLRKDGEPLKNQPGEHHPVWEHFHLWLESYKWKRRA